MNLHTPSPVPDTAPAIERKGHARRQGGFTMLELSFILSAMAGLIVVLAYLTTDLFSKRQAIDGDRLLMLADAQVKEFAARNGRLPCPDTTSNGVEDCGAPPNSKGFLPYRTLGLATQTYVVGETPLRYGVYRNSDTTLATDADLAVKALRFTPRNSDGKGYPETNPLLANSADFCLALANAKAASFSAERAYVEYPGGSKQNVAYAIAFPGSGNRDGGATAYDRLNEGGAAGFQARNTPPSDQYDDKTIHRGFDELYRSLNCEVVLRSLDFVADAVAFEEEVFSLADDNRDAAHVGTILAGVGAGVAAWGLAQSIAEIAGAAEVLGVSIGLLSTAAATCPIPPWVTCALIPVYSVAVATAGTGVALAAVGAGLNGAAVGLQITATIKYADIKSRTGLTLPSTPPAASADERAALNVALNRKNGELETAQDVLNTRLNDEAALRNTASTERTALEGVIGDFTGPLDPFAGIFTTFKESLFGKDTGNKETLTTTYTDANGVTRTTTSERSVIAPGVYQAVMELRDANLSFARASDAHESAIDAGKSTAEVQAALDSKTTAEARVTTATSTLQTKRTALSTAIRPFDTYDAARVTQASAKVALDQKTAAYNACLTDAVCNADPTLEAQKLGEKTAAQADYDAATTARTKAYSALGLTTVDSGVGGLCGASACNVLGRADTYVTAELALDVTATRVVGRDTVTEPATSDRLEQEGVVKKLTSERDTLVLKIGVNTCAQEGKDYDPVAKVCLTSAPGTASAAATRSAVCDTSASTYHAATCTALTAAAGEAPAAVAPVQGAENILRALKREGAVR